MEFKKSTNSLNSATSINNIITNSNKNNSNSNSNLSRTELVRKVKRKKLENLQNARLIKQVPNTSGAAANNLRPILTSPRPPRKRPPSLRKSLSDNQLDAGGSKSETEYEQLNQSSSRLARTNKSRSNSEVDVYESIDNNLNKKTPPSQNDRISSQYSKVFNKTTNKMNKSSASSLTSLKSLKENSNNNRGEQTTNPKPRPSLTPKGSKSGSKERLANPKRAAGSNETDNAYLDLKDLTANYISTENYKFIEKWMTHKSLYANTQTVLLVFNLFTGLAVLSLCVWLNVDSRFIFITNLSNRLEYSSFNRLMGLLIYLLIVISAFSVVLDLAQIFSFVYVKRFLNSHNHAELDRILVNQVLKTKLIIFNESIEEESNLKNFRLRERIEKRIRSVTKSLSTLNYFIILLDALFVFGPLYFFGLFLHFNFDSIVEYQMPQSIFKLIKEFERQQVNYMYQMDQLIVKVYEKSMMHLNTREEKLVNQMHVSFKCCHYQNPYQYGQYTPDTCNLERGCLTPIQEFLWNYLYFGVIIFLSLASLKLCIQIVMYINYRILLRGKLIDRLYFFKTDALRDNLFRRVENESIDELEENRRRSKLEEIRKEKELLLEKEEQEEEAQNRRIVERKSLRKDLEKRQLEFEEKLRREGRWEELKFEQELRKNQTQHLIDMVNKDDAENEV